MKNKGYLKTVRLSRKESDLVDSFLSQNQAIENFSTLARIAILDLISKKGSIPLRPIIEETPFRKPSFLWDYDISEGEIQEILSGPLEKRKWLVAKILEHANFEEVWKYLTPRSIERDLFALRLKRKTREHWEYAIKRWKRVS